MDIHSNLVIPLGFLDGDKEQGEHPAALAVFQVDGLRTVQLSIIVGLAEGWEDRTVGGAAIVKGHMRALRFEDAPTAGQLLEWAAKQGIVVVVLKALDQQALAARLDAECGESGIMQSDFVSRSVD